MDMLRYIRSRIPGANEAKKPERDEYFDFHEVILTKIHFQ
jgi:hypothetical protein